MYSWLKSVDSVRYECLYIVQAWNIYPKLFVKVEWDYLHFSYSSFFFNIFGYDLVSIRIRTQSMHGDPDLGLANTLSYFNFFAFFKSTHFFTFELGVKFTTAVGNRFHKILGSYKSISKCPDPVEQNQYRSLILNTVMYGTCTSYISGGGPEWSIIMLAVSRSSTGNLAFKART